MTDNAVDNLVRNYLTYDFPDYKEYFRSRF